MTGVHATCILTAKGRSSCWKGFIPSGCHRMGITQTGLALLLIAFIYLLTLAGSTFTEQVGCHRPYNMWHPDADDHLREATKGVKVAAEMSQIAIADSKSAGWLITRAFCCDSNAHSGSGQQCRQMNRNSACHFDLLLSGSH